MGNSLFCNAALGANAKGLEYFLPIGCVERVVEPARGTERFGIMEVLLRAIRHGLIDTYLGLMLGFITSAPF